MVITILVIPMYDWLTVINYYYHLRSVHTNYTSFFIFWTRNCSWYTSSSTKWNKYNVVLINQFNYGYYILVIYWNNKIFSKKKHSKVNNTYQAKLLCQKYVENIYHVAGNKYHKVFGHVTAIVWLGHPLYNRFLFLLRHLRSLRNN